MNMERWLPRLQAFAAWTNGLLWFGLWLWACAGSYQGAGLGGLLAWLVFGSAACVLAWLFFDRLFVHMLDAWLYLAFIVLGIAGFFALIGLLWNVRL